MNRAFRLWLGWMWTIIVTTVMVYYEFVKQLEDGVGYPWYVYAVFGIVSWSIFKVIVGGDE